MKYTLKILHSRASSIKSLTTIPYADILNRNTNLMLYLDIFFVEQSLFSSSIFMDIDIYSVYHQGKIFFSDKRIPWDSDSECSLADYRAQLTNYLKAFIPKKLKMAESLHEYVCYLCKYNKFNAFTKNMVDRMFAEKQQNGPLLGEIMFLKRGLPYTFDNLMNVLLTYKQDSEAKVLFLLDAYKHVDPLVLHQLLKYIEAENVYQKVFLYYKVATFFNNKGRTKLAFFYFSYTTVLLKQTINTKLLRYLTEKAIKCIMHGNWLKVLCKDTPKITTCNLMPEIESIDLKPINHITKTNVTGNKFYTDNLYATDKFNLYVRFQDFISAKLTFLEFTVENIEQGFFKIVMLPVFRCINGKEIVIRCLFPKKIEDLFRKNYSENERSFVQKRIFDTKIMHIQNREKSLIDKIVQITADTRRKGFNEAGEAHCKEKRNTEKHECKNANLVEEKLEKLNLQKAAMQNSVDKTGYKKGSVKKTALEDNSCKQNSDKVGRSDSTPLGNMYIKETCTILTKVPRDFDSLHNPCNGENYFPNCKQKDYTFTLINLHFDDNSVVETKPCRITVLYEKVLLLLVETNSPIFLKEEEHANVVFRYKILCKNNFEPRIISEHIEKHTSNEVTFMLRQVSRGSFRFNFQFEISENTFKEISVNYVVK